MATRIILRIPQTVKRTALVAASQGAALAALVVFVQIIVWTAELFR